MGGPRTLGSQGGAREPSDWNDYGNDEDENEIFSSAFR